jgi:general stress protein 26
MSTLSPKEISKEMAKIDFAMLTTRTNSGELATRPMSSWDSARTITDIENEPKVALSFQGSGHLLGKPPLFIAIEGHASLIRDKASFKKHWHKELDRWFPDGVDSDGLILIRVSARRAHYWDGEEDNEVPL